MALETLSYTLTLSFNVGLLPVSDYNLGKLGHSRPFYTCQLLTRHWQVRHVIIPIKRNTNLLLCVIC